MPGNSRQIAYCKVIPEGGNEATVAPVVEIVITTVWAELPGVTAVEGLNRHCAPAGSPEQASVTAALKIDPTGWSVRL
jgi:hypothetical protein